MQKQCRDNGIDAALNPTIDGKKVSLDALLFCDVRGAGQQIAAQACTSLSLLLFALSLHLEGITNTAQLTPFSLSQLV